jgi:hypothetical protein
VSISVLLCIIFRPANDTSSIGYLYLVFCGLCLILTITEVVMILRRKLHPLAFVIMNVLKSALWTALFVLDFVVSSRQLYHRSAIVGRVIDVILMYVSFLPLNPPHTALTTYLRLAFYIPLIHGSLIYHRYRTGSAYRAVDTKRFSDTSEVVEKSQSSSPQAYKSLANVEVVDDVDLEANTNDSPTEIEPQTPRRLSYNHVRDTRFDSYKQTRRSFSDPNVVMGMGMGSPTAELGKGKGKETERSRSSTLNIPRVVINDHDAEMEERGLHSNGRAELD